MIKIYNQIFSNIAKYRLGDIVVFINNVSNKLNNLAIALSVSPKRFSIVLSVNSMEGSLHFYCLLME
jgi:hypothetical protein